VSVPEAVSCAVAAGAKVVAAGEVAFAVTKLIEVGRQVIKVTGRLLTPLSVANIVLTPGTLAVASPVASIVATVGVVLVQVGVPIRGMVLPLESLPVAVN